MHRGPQLGNALCLELPPFHEAVATAEKGPLSMPGAACCPQLAAGIVCSWPWWAVAQQGELRGHEEQGAQFCWVCLGGQGHLLPSHP